MCHVYFWKPLKISSCLALFILISSHGVAAKPGTCKCNRSFHSQDVSQPQIGGSFWKNKKKLCMCKPYNIECHYACIYGFNLFLALCQISACENGSLLWRDEQMRCSRERCTGNVALTFTLTVGCNENIYKNTINVSRSLYIS